jgi:hypothetical protein
VQEYCAKSKGRCYKASLAVLKGKVARISDEVIVAETIEA